jgi:hypothetical protein
MAWDSLCPVAAAPVMVSQAARNVIALVPEGGVEGLRQLARDLCQRQEAGAPMWPGSGGRLSPSAELMVDPGCGAGCGIRDTGAPGERRYHWTVTVFRRD